MTPFGLAVPQGHSRSEHDELAGRMPGFGRFARVDLRVGIVLIDDPRAVVR